MRNLYRQLWLWSSLLLTHVSSVGAATNTSMMVDVESAVVEIMHNTLTHTGTALMQPLRCEKNCRPLKLIYDTNVYVLWKGRHYPAKSISRSMVSQASVGYNSKTMLIDYINFYKY